VIAVIVFVAAVGVLVSVVFWTVIDAKRNQGIASGTDRPFPEGYGAAEPPYLPTPLVSDAEEFRLQAEEALTKLERRRRERELSRSWMDKPGALEADGLYDASEPAESPNIRTSTSRRSFPQTRNGHTAADRRRH
jgi:hypothetical protein